MPLRLRQAVAGRPNALSTRNVGGIVLNEKGYIIYPSGSNVVLTTPEGDLSDTLPFWASLHHRATTSTPGNVRGVCCSQVENIIVAWSESHVVLWQHSSTKKAGSWNNHSTVLASSAITSLDYISGTLVLGTQNGIEYWRMDPQAEVVVWDRLWARPYPTPSDIHISPASGHIAWYTKGQKSAYVLGTDRKNQAVGMAQEIRHPREISWIGWRKPSIGSVDSHLYTITTNSVFRIYSPVLDDPSWFQLLSSLDHKAFSKSAKLDTGKGKEPQSNQFGAMWVWDAEILREAVKGDLTRIREKQIEVPVNAVKLLQGLESEENDIIAWISENGEIVLRSIVNMERKPPTLLKTLPLSVSTLPILSASSSLSSAQLLYIPGPSAALHALLPPTEERPTATSHRISLIKLLSSKQAAIITESASTTLTETGRVQLSNPIEKFARTPNGRGLLAICENGEIGTWYKQQLSLKPAKWHLGPRTLIGRGHWTAPTVPSEAALFAKGRAIVLCTRSSDGHPIITLQHLDSNASEPREPLMLPHFNPKKDDHVEMLLAVSDIDDGYSGGNRRTQRAIITAATRNGEAWVWRVISRITPKEGDLETQPEIQLVSHYRLPLDDLHEEVIPKMILPVDPMGWHQSVIDWTTDTPLQDLILTISSDGDLEFWTPRIGGHLAGQQLDEKVKYGDIACENREVEKGDEAWIKTGTVKTGRQNILMARCSSRKKTVLVCELEDGRHEMTIWDSKVSEFSTGLELTHIFEQGDIILDLDWTTTSDLQSVLAVGFAHKVVLVCEQRMSYIETTPGWAPFLTIDMERYTPVPISDSIWLAGGALAVGTGNQIYLFSRFLVKSVALDEEEPEDIFQLIAHRNGPLVDYHPIQLGQCLLWDKADLVKGILLDLLKSYKKCEEDGKERIRFSRLDPSEFYSKRKRAKAVKVNSNKYDGLFDSFQPPQDDEDDEFTDRAVSELVDRLNGNIAFPLSTPEKSFLATIAQATLEAEQQRRSLDLCGMRYLYSLRMFANWDRLSSISNTPISASTSTFPNHNMLGADHKEEKRNNHFSFRNIVWATHSESHELLLSASKQMCKDGKLLWKDARRMGIFLWLKPGETFKSQLEDIARNRFMQDEDRDPTSCSLIFFALGKKKVVHGLWRQAPSHKEQTLMLKFLANDFELDRWKTAALKNAYALLSKQRYEYAAAFFMLGGAPKDAINVCLRHLNDWQLAVALARIVENQEQDGKSIGPLLRWILQDTVLPIAFKGGHRWLASWAFWTLGRRDLSVKILISPMNDIALDFASDPDHPLEVGNPDNDDPSLLLMFQHLKSKSLQTAKGTNEVSTKLEYDFVLHNARVFFRMGCHNLALDLLRSWSFERPFFPSRTKQITRTQSIAPATPSSIPSPSVSLSTISTSPISARPTISGLNNLTSSYIGHNRRPSFMLTSEKRRESLFMDIDVLAESSNVTSETQTPIESNAHTPDGASTPEEVITNGHTIHEETNESDRADKEIEEIKSPPKKIGNLMKELKQDVQQGGMEFNMDNFF
uniref:WD-repeat protein n=1 Tax=Kwoniella pini CBS 10737 TaxID=1296096 RepID=A0A1B9ICK5_9TREE|nr:WD-repeat protein [Kwoniella pini CBS 10737]OCF53213.1 WD-repeat protein [Kwoniella pini CBS 10737]